MSSKFVKSAIVAGLALAAAEANAQVVTVGCAVPGNNTTGATVYSIDAYTSAGAAVTLPSAYVAVGSVCSNAINAMLPTYNLTGVNNLTIQGAGYSLVSYTFDNTADMSPNNTIASISTTSKALMIGCAAPGAGTAGSTVYSVDAYNSVNAAISSTINAALGAKCSAGLSNAVTTYALTATATKLVPTNLTINNAGYSLQQYLLIQ